MTDAVMVTAASDAVLAVVIAVPVLLVGGGIALVSRRRGPTPGDDGGSSGGVAVAERPEPATAPAPTAVGAPPAEAPVEAAPEAPEAPAPPEPEPASYRGRLGKARGLLSGYIGSVRAKGRIDAATWDDLEEALIRADVGVGATDALLDDLRGRVKSGEIGGPDALVDALKADLVAMLSTGRAALAEVGADRPAPEGDEPARTVDVWLFVGVNGVGKTTTVGKVATRLSGAGTPVLLAAGDTFRAAAGEQLSLWAERSGADVVRGAEGGDPSSVVFDAVQRAASKGTELVLADTAGRLHNKVNLIEELKKIRRVLGPPAGPGDRGAVGARRHHRAERPGPGQGVPRRRGRLGRRPDQARRDGQGGHRGGHPAGAGPARQARRPRRGCR